MSEDINEAGLRQLLADHFSPDPTRVQKLTLPGRPAMDYYNHAHVTKDLIEADPTWTYTLDRTPSGEPAVQINEDRGNAVLWGTLTVFGITRPCVGEAKLTKPLKNNQTKPNEELEKELISDLLKNGAMRFGIALNLWARETIEVTVDKPPVSPPQTLTYDSSKETGEKQTSEQEQSVINLSKEFEKEGGVPKLVAEAAGLSDVKAADMTAMQAAAYLGQLHKQTIELVKTKADKKLAAQKAALGERKSDG